MNYIKTNNKWARQRGTTLIELSVVIAVILLLVGVLFIGVQAWRDGANRAACLVNLSTIQKAVRGYENMNNLNTGEPLVSTALTTAPATGGSAMLNQLPTCPIGNKAYNYGTTVPVEGTAYAQCAATTNGGPHTPTSTANW
jgi:prepilin-type N-terminal cleavage/methylation domain-containing protein